MRREKEMKRGSAKRHLGNMTLWFGKWRLLVSQLSRGAHLTHFLQPGTPAKNV